MKRVLLGSVLPVLTLGLAATFVGPSLLDGPRGEPIRVAAEPASLQLASFAAGPCAVTLLSAWHVAGGEAAAYMGPEAAIRIAAVALPSAPGDVAVAVAAIPAGSAAPSTSFLLVFDANGRIVAAGEAATLGNELAGSAPHVDCLAEGGPAGI